MNQQSTPITDDEARALGLPGGDTYRKLTHLGYKNDINRAAVVAQLNREALRGFRDTITFSAYGGLREEAGLFKDHVLGATPFPHAPLMFARMENINLENFKIATGFELHFKACLYGNDFLVHEIVRSGPYEALSAAQKKRPIHKSELFAIGGFQYDGSANILPGIGDKSLGFDLILNKPAYHAELGKTEEILSVAEDYRSLRNQIHLPGDAVDAPHLNSYQGEELMSMLIEFINRDIVEATNALVELAGLGMNARLPAYVVT